MRRGLSELRSGLHPVQWALLAGVIALGVAPLILAVLRLQTVTGTTIGEAFQLFSSQSRAPEALQFSLIEAAASTLLTLAVGLPIAWALGRYRWKRIRLQRTLLYLPFVTPPIVAAVGFLAMFSEGGWVHSIGLNFRSETNNLSNPGTWFTEGLHLGQFSALIVAHAWFNVSLMIRFVEPVVAQLDPKWDEQLRLLPSGQTVLGRLRTLWAPMLGPAIAVAATYTFFFSFTSFALVRWLTPGRHTLESLLADLGGSAGIEGYRTDTSLAVLSIAGVQMALMLLMLWSAGRFERSHSHVLSLNDESSNRAQRGTPPLGWVLTVGTVLVLSMTPYVSVIVASFRMRGQAGEGFTWTLAGWRRALTGDSSTTSFMEAVVNSLTYAGITVLVALPLGYGVASALTTLRKRGYRKTAGVLDSLCMIPLSVSAVVVGLGIVVGVLRWYPDLFRFPYLPALPHIMLVLPFVIRLLVPAMERINELYAQQANLLQMSSVQRWWHSRGAFLMPTMTMAASLCLAFSLGEFGASFLVVRVGSWDTLSVMVDTVAGRPKFDPAVIPTAMALASMLMLLTFIILGLNERLRTRGGTDDV